MLSKHMIVLLLAIIIGLGITFFAFQNTEPTTVRALGYSMPNIPLFLVMISSFVGGLIVAWVLSLSDTVSAFFKIRKRESSIETANREINTLESRVHELEIENARLQGDGKYKTHLEEHEAESSLAHRLTHKLRGD